MLSVALFQTKSTKLTLLQQIACTSMYVIFILVTGFRWRTGTDWLSYEYFFEAALSGIANDFGGTFEVGYLLLVEIWAKIFSHFTFMLLFQSLTIGYLIHRSARYFDVSAVGLLVGLLFIQSQFWYPVRQQLAVAIIMFCLARYTSARSYNTTKTFIETALAGSIHSSALIMLPILGYFRRSLSSLILMLGVIVFVGYRYGPEILDNFMQSRIDTYIFENEYDDEGNRVYLRLLERFISVLLVISFLRGDYFKLSREKINILSVLIVSGFLISISSLVYFPYLARLALYFNWAEAVVFAGIISNIRALSSFRVALFGLWLVLLFCKFIYSLIYYWDLLDPYYFVFEDYQRSVY